MRRQAVSDRTNVPQDTRVGEDTEDDKKYRDVVEKSPLGAAVEWLLMLILVVYGGWVVVYFQAGQLPAPLSAAASGAAGFSEERAIGHVQNLVSFGPHPVGTKALEQAFQYVYSELVQIKDEAHDFVDVELEIFTPNPGFERLREGVFFGKTLVYANLKHIVVRVSPSNSVEAKDFSLLVSSHIDTVITSPGAGDCSSCISIMVELVRALSHRAQRFKHSVIFLFNTGEEEGLLGAHGFITQHPWSSTIRAVIDIEAMGVGGKSLLFQAGPDSWLLEQYTKVAKYPSAHALAQDAFHFGLVHSATDFQVYVEVGGLSGIDFAHLENNAVYHTKNDKLWHLRPGSLQPVGRDLVALLDTAAQSDELPFVKVNATGFTQMETVFFDVLGRWMVTYSMETARRIQISILIQGLVLLVSSMFLSGTGTAAFVELGLAILTLVLTWLMALAHVLLVAIILPYVSPFPLPYIAHSWIAVGLFGFPAVFGALLGQAIGRALLAKYIGRDGRRQAELHAERWLFKAGMLQWMLLLGLGTWVGAGSSVLALFWLVPPAIAYGLMETKFSPQQRLRGIKRTTLWLSSIVGLSTTAFPAVRLGGVIIGGLARAERNPGSAPVWAGNAVSGGLIAGIVCLTLIYLLPFAHRSGGLKWILLGLTTAFIVTLGIVVFEVVPAFTEHVSRGLHLVHVVDTKSLDPVTGLPSQKISLFAATAGGFEKELNAMKDEDFVCGKSIDYVSFLVKSGCEKPLDDDKSLLKGQPSITVESDKVSSGQRVTSVRLTAGASYRWNLAINTTAVESFKLETSSDRQVLVPGGKIFGVNGWHNLQYCSGKPTGPDDFYLTLYWHPEEVSDKVVERSRDIQVLRLRTDVNHITPEFDKLVTKLPAWCTLFGKSTGPYPLAYLAELKL
ncbi:hypothetical protein R1sor_003931 [Riccia sorocarpa]|uniref:Vacuolar membrane protease n=1 Tax=Riccia sorocarpa TaxID=122646 RepID=A0ABD3H965_9MARC